MSANQYNNPFASPLTTELDVEMPPEHVAIDADDLDLATAGVASKPNMQPAVVSGVIGAATRTDPNARYTTGPVADTLDEPVTTTIMRDLRSIGEKIRQVLHPKGRPEVLKDWDLWGPLFLCLSLAIILSITAPPSQSVLVFTGVFVIVWCGAAIVTLNAKLLGGAVSFFQSVCVLGYCLFPLVVAAIFSLFFFSFFIRLPIVIATYVWASYASLNFLSGSHLTNRRALASYPLFLFYFVLAWVILISK
ncbi:uncharacterized protein VTP21DRAFT_5636 [Calcarisporiella thermophila]|uniref:uncharacterized protein n=1 Tax=Calcarisporiella thermophila TaxID=911321 RepID=UPI0037428FD2